eukprot:7087162-Prymnesium_polylepis.1
MQPISVVQRIGVSEVLEGGIRVDHHERRRMALATLSEAGRMLLDQGVVCEHRASKRSTTIRGAAAAAASKHSRSPSKGQGLFGDAHSR